MQYSQTAVVIEDPATNEWAVSFTSHNPERDDSVDCKTEGDAWRLKRIWDESHSPNIINDCRQTSVLRAVVIWLEANGHREPQEAQRGTASALHQHCYACRILDQCKAALLNASVTGAGPASRARGVGQEAAP